MPSKFRIPRISLGIVGFSLGALLLVPHDIKEKIESSFLLLSFLTALLLVQQGAEKIYPKNVDILNYFY